MAAGLQALPVAVAVLDRRGKILFANEAWEHSAGASAMVSRDCAVGRNYLAVCDREEGAAADTARRVAEGVRAVLVGARDSVTVEYADAPGTAPRWYSLRAIRFHDERAVRVLIVHDDVTDRRRAARERQESAARTRILAEVSRAFAEARLDMGAVASTIARAVSDSMRDGCGISVLAPDGRTLRPLAIHHEDPEARQFLTQLLAAAPFPADNPLFADVLFSGRPLRLWVGDDVESARALIDEVYRSYLDRFTVCGVLAVPLWLDGRVIGLLVSWRSRPEHEYTVDDEVLFQELADRAALAIANAQLYVELEQRVGERTVQLEAANRELEAFCYSVSHDLRAPLRSIGGFAAALRDDHGDALPQAGHALLDRVLAGAGRMQELIDDLLGLARTARADMYRTPVSLTELAREVGAELQRLHPDRAVDFAVADDLVVDGDARLLRAALENLLGNAWKYTAKHASARIELGSVLEGNEHVFFVRDDGAGFDMQYADKLFGPFQRLHSAAEFTGSGIGLATVQRIVARHGGRIWADAAVERGATFYFTLGARAET